MSDKNPKNPVTSLGHMVLDIWGSTYHPSFLAQQGLPVPWVSSINWSKYLKGGSVTYHDGRAMVGGKARRTFPELTWPGSKGEDRKYYGFRLARTVKK